MDGHGHGHGHGAVVVADDDAAVRMVCRVNLEFEGYRVFEAASADELDRVLSGEDVDAVLLDVHLGADDGVDVARSIRERRPEIRIAFFTGSADRRETAGVRSDGFLTKPFTLEDLTETVRQLVSR